MPEPAPPSAPTASTPFRILSLDGGGSKGMFTIGALAQVEKDLGSPLKDHFNLVYGTSTGAIIAALVCLGKTIPEIESIYRDLIPRIMGARNRRGRTQKLKEAAQEIFQDKTFDAFTLPIGIVATRCDKQRPMIFKSKRAQALSMKSTFEPGFGCTIAEAIVASAAAYPYFLKARIKPSNEGGGEVEVIDGGFVANNPSLFALIDAIESFKMPESNVHLLSVGVGEYLPKSPTILERFYNLFPIKSVMETALIGNINSFEIILAQLHPLIRCVRLNRPCKVAADLLEKDKNILSRLYLEGRETLSVDGNEAKVSEFFR